MPRPDLVEHLSTKLDRLSHPDGKARRLMQYATFHLNDERKSKVQQSARGIAEAIVHESELAGYTISHHNDPKPADAEGHKIVSLVCMHCGNGLGSLKVDDELHTRLGRPALEALRNIPLTCEEHQQR